MGFIGNMIYNFIESKLDRAEQMLDHVQDTVDIVCHTPKEVGMKRGYEKAANEFEPIVAEIEKEYEEVIEFIAQTNRTYEEKTQYLLDKIKVLNEEKERLINRRNHCAEQHGINVENSRSIIENPNGNVCKLIVEARIAQMKQAEQAAYREAVARFDRKVTQMRQRLRAYKHQANENLKKRIELVEACLEEIAELQKQIAASGIL